MQSMIIIIIIIVVIIVPYLVFVVSKAQMLGWITALKQLINEEGDHNAKRKKEK